MPTTSSAYVRSNIIAADHGQERYIISRLWSDKQECWHWKVLKVRIDCWKQSRCGCIESTSQPINNSSMLVNRRPTIMGNFSRLECETRSSSLKTLTVFISSDQKIEVTTDKYHWPRLLWTWCKKERIGGCWVGNWANTLLKQNKLNWVQTNSIRYFYGDYLR